MGIQLLTVVIHHPCIEFIDFNVLREGGAGGLEYPRYNFSRVALSKWRYSDVYLSDISAEAPK